MKKIQAHILKIKKWNQELDKIKKSTKKLREGYRIIINFKLYVSDAHYYPVLFFLKSGIILNIISDKYC